MGTDRDSDPWTDAGADPRSGDWLASYRQITRALASDPPDRAAVLAAVTQVATLRDDLAGLERAAIDTARRSGASWAQVAAALGLRSRQAAEQRRLRLDAAGPTPMAGAVGDAPGGVAGTGAAGGASARTARRRQRAADIAAGRRVVDLRHAVRDLVAALDVAGSGVSHGRARLARSTLHLALRAEPGPLFDLARLAVADLEAAAVPVVRSPRVAAALDRVGTLAGPYLES